MVVSEAEGEEVVASLSTHGMLSPVIEEWRLSYVKLYEPWLTTARDVHDVAMKAWMAHWMASDGLKVTDLMPTAARVFGRGITNLAAAVILCERGSAIEAAALARSISEASFWLAYLAEAADAGLSDLEADDLKNWIDRERELQRVCADDPEIVAKSKLNEATYRAKLDGRKPLSIKAIAQKYGTRNGYLKYRIMSGFYSHLSHASLRHNLLTTGEKTGLNILGPHSHEIPKALYFACDSLIDCGAAYSVIVNDQESAQSFAKSGAAVQAMRELPTPVG